MWLCVRLQHGGLSEAFIHGGPRSVVLSLQQYPKKLLRMSQDQILRISPICFLKADSDGFQFCAKIQNLYCLDLVAFIR